MTSFATIRQCFPKFNANGTLLILTFAAFQLFARASAALPVVTGSVHYASRFGPHSSPGRIPVGDKVLVGANIDSSDPIGSPTISVEAVQGGTTLTLERRTPNSQSTQYTKFIDLDPALTGFWEIIPTDSTGTGPSSFTNAIVEPEFIPLVEDTTVQGTPLGARVSWTLPNLDGFDVDEAVVRFYEAASELSVWISDSLPVQTTSFQVPTGILQAGVDYVAVVLLGDFEGPYVENASWTFSEPFHYTDVTATADFNNDGTLDAADIDDLTIQTAGGTNPAPYDLNSDALVDDGDIKVWIGDLFHSWIGDASLDGEFNSSDLVTVLAAGTYEVDVDSVWSTGDFNGDGRANSSDLVAALADGGYEQGPRAAVSAVQSQHRSSCYWWA